MALERLKEMIRKMGSKEEEEDYVPRQLIDRHLDSLRRQRQFQLNELEKEKLKKEISEYNKEKERKYLWGLKDKKKRKLLEKLKKKKEYGLRQNRILQAKSLLNNRKDEFRKTKTNILSNRGSFLGRGNL